MEYFKAVKEWNIIRNNGMYCSPKKGTPEYDEVKALMMSKQKATPKPATPKPKATPKPATPKPKATPKPATAPKATPKPKTAPPAPKINKFLLVDNLDSMDLPYIIEQYYPDIANSIINLNKKNKVWTDLIFNKILKNYKNEIIRRIKKGILKIEDVKDGIIRILNYFIEDQNKINDSLTNEYFM